MLGAAAKRKCSAHECWPCALFQPRDCWRPVNHERYHVGDGFKWTMADLDMESRYFAARRTGTLVTGLRGVESTRHSLMIAGPKHNMHENRGNVA